MTSPYTVVNICQILYSKRCVDEPALDDVESGGISLEDKKKLLLAKVHLRLSDDHRKLHELATVLDLFKETKSVAKSILNDYILDVEQKEMPAKSAKEAILKNTSRVIDAVTGCSFQGFVTGCAEKSLITPYYRSHLLHDTPMNKEALLIGEIEKVVHFQPSCLDTVLCILIDKCGIPGTVVAEAVANDYGHMLPNYEKTKPTIGTATSVVSCDDNVEEMVCSEDRASDILRSHYSTLSQSLKDPVNIARLLHGENVISEDAVTQVNSAAIKDRTTVLLGSIRKAIHDNHQHLKVFGRVLQQLTAGIERVGQDISNDYDKVFPTTSIFSMTSTPSTTTVQSTTGAEPTATDVHHRITLDMEKKFSHIRIKFGKLFREVKQTLINHNVPVDDIKSFCKLTYPKCSQDVNDRQTMEDVLAFVGKKCTLIDVSVLEELIDDCEIDEAKQHIQHYQQAIDDFSQNMRTRFPLNQSLLPDGTPHPLRGETITFVTDWNKETVSLDDIKDLLKYAFESHSMHVKVIVINETNSIMITCLFPFELTGLLMAVAMKNLRLLKKNGLLKLTIGYCTIWNIRDEEETDKLNEVIKEEMNVETVGDTSDIITDQQRDTESELVGQTDKTIEELQQLLQGNEDQTFQSQTTTPPSSSDTPSDKATTTVSSPRHHHQSMTNQDVNVNAGVNTQDHDGVTALIRASYCGNVKEVELLLKKNANVNICAKNGDTALMGASFKGHGQVVELLLKANADVNLQKKDGGTTALILASVHGHHHIVEKLLKANANVNICANTGCTALFGASLNGHKQVVESLLKESADANIQDKAGLTALMAASVNGHDQVVALLLNAAAKVNIQANDGGTALMRASINGHNKVVKLLLMAKADVNIQYNNGTTALMLASQYGHDQVLELLLMNNSS